MWDAWDATTTAIVVGLFSLLTAWQAHRYKVLDSKLKTNHGTTSIGDSADKTLEGVLRVIDDINSLADATRSLDARLQQIDQDLTIRISRGERQIDALFSKINELNRRLQ